MLFSSLAILACHCKDHTTTFPKTNEAYIIEDLQKRFDVVICVFSSDNTNNNITSTEVRDSKEGGRLIYCHVENGKGLDFEKWRQIIIHTLPSSLLTNLKCLLLINDSCTLEEKTKSMDSIFQWAENIRDAEVLGITDSFEKMYHLQSYFLLFRGQDVIKDVHTFFQQVNPCVYQTKDALVDACEIGLSQYLRNNCGRRLKAMFDTELIFKTNLKRYVIYFLYLVIISLSLHLPTWKK
jgi:hypothetical protein